MRHFRSPQATGRHEIGLAAEAIREELRFTKLAGEINLSAVKEMMLKLGGLLDDFAVLLVKECGEDPQPVRGAEFFYCAGELLATYLDERRQEIRIAEDSDPSADRACWEYHNAR